MSLENIKFHSSDFFLIIFFFSLNLMPYKMMILKKYKLVQVSNLDKSRKTAISKISCSFDVVTEYLNLKSNTFQDSILIVSHKLQFLKKNFLHPFKF